MKTALLALAFLSLALAGCVVAPAPGYGDRGWSNGGHGEYHAQQGQWTRY